MDNELSRVVDALPGLVWTARSDGDIDFVNHRWCEYTGLRVDEAQGRGWQAAIHAEDRPELIARWQSILASGEPGEMEARLRRFDGQYHRFLFRACPSTQSSGQVMKWCGVNTDIEDHREAEEAQRSYWWLTPRARRDHFRVVADSLRDLAWLVTPAGIVETVNGQTLEYFGATLDQAKSWTLADTVHPDDLAEVLAVWRRAVETNQPYDVEARLRRADGSYCWFETRGIPLRDMEGRIVFWYLLKGTSTTADGVKFCSPVKSGCSKWWRPAIRFRSCSMRYAGSSKRSRPAAHAACSCSIQRNAPAAGRFTEFSAEIYRVLHGRPVSVENGPCAMAACLNEQVVSSDIRTETRWGAYRWCELALSFGLQACWSTPISSKSGKVLGTFGLHYHVPATPTPLQQKLIERFTHLARLAIERAQAEDALKRSQAFLTEAERLSVTGSFSLDLATGDHWWSEQTYRIFGVDSASPPSFEVMRERVHPDDLVCLNHCLERASAAKILGRVPPADAGRRSQASAHCCARGWSFFW